MATKKTVKTAKSGLQELSIPVVSPQGIVKIQETVPPLLNGDVPEKQDPGYKSRDLKTVIS